MNKLIQYCVFIAVGVLVFATLLVPVINDASNALTVTKENNYGIYASALDEDATISCIVDTDNEKITWAVNEETTEYPLTDVIAKVVLVTDKMQVYIDTTGTLTVATYTNARFTGQTELTVTMADGELSGSSTNGTTSHSYTSTYDWAFYASDKGAYRSFYLQNNDNNGVYFTDINEIYGANFVFTTNKFYSFVGDNVTYYATSATPAEITATVNSTPVNGTVDMEYMQLSRNNGDYTFIIDNNGADYTVHPWVFIVPAKVSSDVLNNTDAVRAVVNVVPLIVIVGLIAGIVGVIAVRRNA